MSGRLGVTRVMTSTTVPLLVVAGLTLTPMATASAATLPGANAAAVLARLTEAQRVGQLVMVGASLSGVTTATRTAISTYHAGSVVLTGRSSAGVSAVRSLTNGLQGLATSSATGGVPLLVGTDQEGGYVQALSGPGFDTIPSAVVQGTYSESTLRHKAVRWGRQLAAAGVNLDLAPVLDTVPASATSTNQPIGRWNREYGTTPSRVAAAGKAFIRGMHTSGVQTAIKHFPGLGRADGNTDTTAGVIDTVTTRHDPYITPYAAGTRVAGAGVVMVSLATYTRIDPRHRAVFSPTVIDGMLRHDLGFTGVVMTDSIDAVALRDLTPGQRAVRFVAAGGDLVLTTRPTDVPSIVSALLARARASATFRARVDASTLRVLIAKQRAGLLPGGVAAAASGGRLYLAEQNRGHGVDVYARASGTWSGPVSLGGSTDRTPALAGLPGGAGVEVAAVTPAGTVAVRSYRPAGASTGWRGIGGTATSAPAVTVAASGAIAVAIRATGLGIRVREFSPTAGWGAWTGLGGAFTEAAPAIVYTPAGDLQVFAVSERQRVFRDVRHAGRWSGWVNIGGLADSAPAPAVHPVTGAVRLFVQGSNATLLREAVGSTGWSPVADARPVAGPAAAQTAASVTTVVIEGRDGRLHLARWTSTGWGSWSTLPFD